jgi:glycine cleavage system aminomethyltransferase T
MKLTTFDFVQRAHYTWTRTDQGTYADDCLVNRVTVNKCYVVATVSTPCVDTWLAPTSSLNFIPELLFRLGLIV